MEINFEEVCQLVEKSLEGLKVDPAQCREDKPGKWTTVINNSQVWIDVFNFEAKPEVNYFQVSSPLFKIPEIQREEIQTDLLEFAYSMYGCSVCKRGEWYFVLHLREAMGLGQSEVDKNIDRVAHYSNDIYQKFKFKYPQAIS